MLRFLSTFTLAVCVGWWWFQPASVAAVDATGALSYPGYSVQPLERFELTGRVLSKQRYSHDREAELSPVDLAMGWGPMADPEVLAAFEISQRNRWYFWRTDNMPIPRRDIESHSANIHIIPASQQVADALDRVSEDEQLQLSGHLVEVRGDDGWRWRSSLSRTDTGDGSCEVLLLESIRPAS